MLLVAILAFLVPLGAVQALGGAGPINPEISTVTVSSEQLQYTTTLYYENYSYYNPNGNSLELVPVCESFNTSHWQEKPYNSTIRVIDMGRENMEIESEIFNISMDILGLINSFTSCLVLNFTANQNRTLSYFYAVSLQEETKYKPLDVLETPFDITINNSGYYTVRLNKRLGGISLLKDWSGQEYTRKDANNGNVYMLAGSAAELNTNMLGAAGSEITDADCWVVERGNLRVKVQCKNTTSSHQQYYFSNLTFFKGSYFWEQLMGKTNAGNWAIHSQIVLPDSEIFINNTQDYPLFDRNILIEGSDGRYPPDFSEVAGIAMNDKNIAHLVIWEDKFEGYMFYGYMLDGVYQRWILKLGVDAAQNSITSADSTGNSTRMLLGFVPVVGGTPYSNSSTWMNGQYYFNLFNNPIRASQQAGAVSRGIEMVSNQQIAPDSSVAVEQKIKPRLQESDLNEEPEIESTEKPERISGVETTSFVVGLQKKWVALFSFLGFGVGLFIWAFRTSSRRFLRSK